MPEVNANARQLKRQVDAILIGQPMPDVMIVTIATLVAAAIGSADNEREALALARHACRLIIAEVTEKYADYRTDIDQAAAAWERKQ